MTDDPFAQIDTLVIEPLQYQVKTNGAILYNSREDEMKSYVFVKSRNKFFNVLNGSEMAITAFDLEFADAMPRRSNRPSVYAKTELRVKSVDDTLYYPLSPPGNIFSLDGRTYANEYLPFSVPKADHDYIKNPDWPIVAGHFIKIFNEDDGNILIKWAAWNVQRPGEKILWAPILVGIPGDGKTTILKIMAAACGNKNVRHVSPEALDSAFNSYATGACIVGLEEVRVKGKSRYPIQEALKPLLTNSVIDVVCKGRDPKNVPNVTNYIALTNHPDALALDEDDRRWGVFRTRFESRQDMLNKLDEEYWRKLHAAIENNPEMIRGWLLDRNLSDFNPNTGPLMTLAKEQMIRESRSGPAEEIESIIGTAEGVHDDVIMNSYLAKALKDNGYQMPRGRSLSRALKELGFENGGRKVRWRASWSRFYYRKEAFPEDGPTDDEVCQLMEQTDDLGEVIARMNKNFDENPF